MYEVWNANKLDGLLLCYYKSELILRLSLKVKVTWSFVSGEQQEFIIHPDLFHAQNHDESCIN